MISFRLFRNDRVYETLLPKPPIVVLSQVETPEEVLLFLSRKV